MNSVSIYGILTTKKFIKHSLCVLLPLIFANWCLPYKIPAVVSQHIWTAFSTIPLFSLGNILIKSFATFIGHGFHVFRNKIPNGNAENEISMTCYTLQQCVMKLTPAQFYCDFPLCHCTEGFCRRFKMPSRLFFL